MTTDEKKLITAYLSGPRDWSEGVLLYNRHGQNLRLKRQFAIDNTVVTREIMYDELRKLAGLTEIEFARLPRMAAQAKTAAAEAVKVENVRDIDDDICELAEAPEPVRKMIRFRERYPFLNTPECPDVIKIGVADMFTAYGRYKEAHRRLRALGDDPDVLKAVKDCEAVVEEYINNREIRDELEHYKATGNILGKAVGFRTPQPQENLEEMGDTELIQKLQSARSNTSKNKKAMDDAADEGARAKAQAGYETWLSRREALQKEVNRRKKK